MIDLSLFVNGVDKTSVVRTLTKNDALYDAADILKFTVDTHTGQTYVPVANDEIELFDGATKIFGGVVIQIEKSLDEAIRIVTHEITCRDYSQFLDRQLIVERIENSTVNDVIAMLITKYAPEFTDTYVDADIPVTSITFNNISPLQAIDKLSKLTGYQWYVDYDKAIHFFENIGEPAPFDIVDNDGNVIPETFNIQQDLTQIKNRITVKGGEIEVEPVLFTIKGALGKLQDNGDVTFDMSYKFSKKPTVTVNAVPMEVGIVGFDNEDDFDAMWSYGQKYLNFTSIAIAETDDIEIGGTPLETIQVRVQDSASIALYGRWDAVISVPGIKTREEATQYADAQKEASKDPSYNGSFQTYESGLRSGQVININSTKFGVNENFFIQRVSLRILTHERAVYDVEVSTQREITLLDILAKIVGNQEVDELATEGLLSYIEFEDVVNIVDDDPVFSQTTGPYQTWPDVGSGTGTPFKPNFSTVSS